MAKAEAIERCRAALAAGDYDGARRALEGHAEAPTVETLTLSATAAYGAGDLEGTLAAWERVHALHSESGATEEAGMAAAMVAMYLMMDTGLMAPVRTTYCCCYEPDPRVPIIWEI